MQTYKAHYAQTNVPSHSIFFAFIELLRLTQEIGNVSDWYQRGNSLLQSTLLDDALSYFSRATQAKTSDKMLSSMRKM